jgi:hypothetical protein
MFLYVYWNEGYIVSLVAPFGLSKSAVLVSFHSISDDASVSYKMHGSLTCLMGSDMEYQFA